MSRSKLDSNQILQHAYDDESQSLRSKFTDSEFSVELSYEDGDSARAMSDAKCFDASAEQINITAFRNARLFCAPDETVILEISPDGLTWYELSSLTSSGHVLVEDICAVYAKISGLGKVVFGA